MRTAKKRNNLKLHIDDANFTIQENRYLGLVELKYDRYCDGNNQEGMQANFKLLSCWMNVSTGNCIKAYLAVNPGNPMHRNLVEDIKYLGVAQARNGFTLTTDGKLIRYGMKPGNKPTASGNELNDFQTSTYFDSKAQALKQILEEISRYRTIGGLNQISLNRLPDSLLVEAGFERVDDLLRTHNTKTKQDVPRGVAMWLGNTDRIVGNHVNWSNREEAAKLRNQFLDLLNRMVQA